MNNWKKRFRMMAVVTVLAVMTAFLTACSSAEGERAPGSAVGNVVDRVEAGEESRADETAEGHETGLAVHFIDVGQADSALVLCDGKSMLIDGGNAADSSLIYSYLKDLSVDYLDYIVCTHAHEDHVGGLSGALNYAKIGTALAPVTDYNSKVFKNFVKYVEEQGMEITVPTAGDSFALGSARVDVLGPINPSDDPNNTSIVLKVTYGDTSFLFTGDAEREEEQDILDAGYPLKSTVLKVGHHGSDTSTSYPFLREVMPEYGVISVGKGNSYGHPTEDTLSRLRDADVTVYRTDELGHIVCVSDGTNVEFFSGAEAASTGRTALACDYVLNKNSMKMHLPSCKYAAEISEKNKEYYTGSRETLIEQGYVPCGSCKP
ncbi:MAG: ComEC/Rec2 family competence protein [Brotaphodocola sp.]